MNDAPLSLRNMLWLLASLAMVTAPHAERLPWWASALAVMFMLWRIYLGYHGLSLPRKWLLLLIVAGATGGIYLHYRTIFGRDAGVTLLILMLALKSLETQSRRDAILLIFICYFVVITNFFYSQTIPTAVYMLICVWIITASTVGLHYTQSSPGYRRQLRTAGVLLAQSVPLMLALFLFFPRVQGPLWGLPVDAHSGMSGLSDTMAPGSLSNLSRSGEVAFRVDFTSPPPPPKELYWRGPVLWDFDGRTWTALRYAYGEPQFQAAGKPLEYEVTVEPHGKRWLFALELPAVVPPQARVTADFQLISNTPLTSRLRYPMTSYQNASYGIAESRMALRRALQLPDNLNPRTLALAQSLRRKFPDDQALMREVLSMFRDQNFFYTLTPPLLGENPVDEFLFDTKRGFCEHYASSFAVLMRAAGIPARIITGYQGGDINPVGNYMIVRQADAHAWTEVWFRDAGWVRVDPTAAVSPRRVEAGIASAVPATDPLPFMVRGDYKWLQQVRLNWDSLSYTWNKWVLGYNPERQRHFLAQAGLDNATWRTLALILIAVSGLITLVLALFVLGKLRTKVRDPVKLAYQRFCAKLARKGLPRDPAEGPLVYAERLARVRPDLATAVAAITRLYVVLRYGAAAGANTALDELRRRVRQFHA